MTGPNDPTKMFTVEYDGVEGKVVVSDFGFAEIREAIEVRNGLVDRAVRYAAIVELEKLGYTVIPPEEPS